MIDPLVNFSWEAGNPNPARMEEIDAAVLLPVPSHNQRKVNANKSNLARFTSSKFIKFRRLLQQKNTWTNAEQDALVAGVAVYGTTGTPWESILVLMIR